MSSGKKTVGLGRRTPIPVSYGPPSSDAITQFFRRRPAKRKASPSEKENQANSPSTSTSAPFGSTGHDTAKVARLCPLPNLKWAEREDVWLNMIKREKKHRLDSNILDKHPEITARMRAVLIDWLIEVSEVYTLHRETLYMAVTYVDRYLFRQSTSIRKSELQLIGVSALFFAAKLEEIYPPKLAEFAYVTDSACTEVEMREMELIMLKKLQWELSPPTAISWLNLYLQAAQLPMQTEFHLPLYPKETFVQIAQLLDLCMLELGSLKFLPSVLAAACLYHFSSEDLALQCSGFTLREISAAIRWVTPFAMTIRDQGLASLRSFRKVKPDDAHNIQTHINNIQSLENAQCRQAQTQASCNSVGNTPTSSVSTPVTPITPADVTEYVTPDKQNTQERPDSPESPEIHTIPDGSCKRSKPSPPSNEHETDETSFVEVTSTEPAINVDETNFDVHHDDAVSESSDLQSVALWSTSPFVPTSNADAGPTSELVTDDLDNPTDEIDHHLSSSRDGLTGSGSPSSALTVSGSSPGSSTLESPIQYTSSVID